MPQIDLWYWVIPQSDPFVRRALSGGSHGTHPDYNGRYARAFYQEGNLMNYFNYFLLRPDGSVGNGYHLHDVWKISLPGDELPLRLWLAHDGMGQGWCQPGGDDCQYPCSKQSGRERRRFADNYDWRGTPICPRFIDYYPDDRIVYSIDNVYGRMRWYNKDTCVDCGFDERYGPVNIRVKTKDRDWGYDIGPRRTVEIRFEGGSPWEIYHFVEGVGCTQYHHENPNDMTAVWAAPWGGGNFGRVNCCQFGNIGD